MNNKNMWVGLGVCVCAHKQQTMGDDDGFVVCNKIASYKVWAMQCAGWSAPGGVCKRGTISNKRPIHHGGGFRGRQKSDFDLVFLQGIFLLIDIILNF